MFYNKFLIINLTYSQLFSNIQKCFILNSPTEYLENWTRQKCLNNKSNKNCLVWRGTNDSKINFWKKKKKKKKLK